MPVRTMVKLLYSSVCPQMEGHAPRPKEDQSLFLATTDVPTAVDLAPVASSCGLMKSNSPRLDTGLLGRRAETRSAEFGRSHGPLTGWRHCT